MLHTERIPLVAVVGPTASGKTALAVSLAKALDAEVLSFDSMQLYKGMDVATAKPTEAEGRSFAQQWVRAYRWQKAKRRRPSFGRKKETE